MNGTVQQPNPTDLLAALAAAGWLPPDDAARPERPPRAWGTDLLPWLERVWSEWQRANVTGRRPCELLRWLERQRAAGACLTLGLPGARGQRLRTWLGLRLCFWPDGVPTGPLVAPVFSHLGRALEERFELFRTLRQVCLELSGSERGDVLLAVRQTAAFPFVRHCAERLRVPLLRAEVRADGSTAGWLRLLLRLPRPETPVSDWPSWRLFVSPPLEGPTARTECGESANQAVPAGQGRASPPPPARDRLALALADRVVALFVRANGRVEQLLCERLSAFGPAAAAVQVAEGAGLVSSPQAQRLFQRGAARLRLAAKPNVVRLHRPTGGRVSDSSGSSGPTGQPQPTDQRQAGRGVVEPPASAKPVAVPVRGVRPAPTDAATPPAPVRPVRPEDGRDFLTHWTRRQNGPWPDQSHTEFLDELLFADRPADRSALSALLRILSTRRLVASGAAIRGAFRVVCFTAVPLFQLPQLRRFRPHRGRWDFELYGLAVRREWLQEKGARPVVYGDERLWKELPETDRPFFQLRFSKRAGEAAVVDWSVEREWRVLGDVDLSGLDADDALVFVPTRAEAERVAPVSPWPVLFFQPCSEAGADAHSDGPLQSGPGRTEV